MTPELMRVAVAESLGFSRFTQRNGRGLCGWTKEQPKDYPFRKDEYLTTVPDFPNDLNACHEFEKTLEPNFEWLAYLKELGKILHATVDTDVTARQVSDAHADGTQRCEAYLRVKNLWKE